MNRDNPQHLANCRHRPRCDEAQSCNGKPCEAPMSERPHLIAGEFQSDKYPTTPRGKVPLSCKDPTAQDLLWAYAQRRRVVDAEFADDLEEALRIAGYDPSGAADALTREHATIAAIERSRPIPIPAGGFTTNEDEVRWLADTIAMRMRETFAAAGINAAIPTESLCELLLIALNAASKRANAREVERRREAEAELRFARELFEDLLSLEIGNCTTNLRAPDQAARRAAVPDDDQGDIPIFEDVIARIDKVLGDATDTPVDRQGGSPDA